MKFVLQSLAFLLWHCTYLLQTVSSYTLMDKEYSFIHFKQWDMDDTGSLKFRFKTHNHYGLLLYTDNSKGSSYTQSYVSLKLNYGQLQFTVQMGAEDYKSNRKVTLGSSLNDLQWHYVTIRRDLKDPRITHIRLDRYEKSIVNDGEHDKLKLDSGLYFGGISNDLENVVDGSLKLEPRLIGCIDEIQYQSGTNSTRFVSPLERSQGAQPGCLNACANNICPNGGRCINYFTTHKCDCIGTGYTGRTCTEEAELLSFDGQTKVEVDVPDNLRSTTNNKIAFRFKTRESNGLLMAAWSGNDHLMIELKNTIIRMSIDLGGGYHIFHINSQSFSDGKWHLVLLTRHGRDVSLMVDQKHSLNRSTSGQFTKFDLRQKLYIGGHPEVESLSLINSESKVNFRGCMQQIYFNNLDILYKVLHTRSSFFHLNGAKITNCSVTKAKVIVARENEENKISESARPVKEKTPIAPTVSSNSVQSSEAKDDNGKTLSKNSVTWIVVGLVCGTLVLIVTVVIIVHNVKHRYSGVFLSSHVKEQYHKQLTPDGAGTLLYTPRNGKVVIEPHLV